MWKKRYIIWLIPLILIIICWWKHPFPLVKDSKIIPDQQIFVVSTTFGFTDDSPELTPREYHVFPQDSIYPELRSLLIGTKCHFSLETIIGDNLERDYTTVYLFYSSTGNMIKVFDDGVAYNGRIWFRLATSEITSFFSELEAILTEA